MVLLVRPIRALCLAYLRFGVNRIGIDFTRTSVSLCKWELLCIFARLLHHFTPNVGTWQKIVLLVARVFFSLRTKANVSRGVFLVLKTKQIKQGLSNLNLNLLHNFGIDHRNMISNIRSLLFVLQHKTMIFTLSNHHSLIILQFFGWVGSCI